MRKSAMELVVGDVLVPVDRDDTERFTVERVRREIARRVVYTRRADGSCGYFVFDAGAEVEVAS